MSQLNARSRQHGRRQMAETNHYAQIYGTLNFTQPNLSSNPAIGVQFVFGWVDCLASLQIGLLQSFLTTQKLLGRRTGYQQKRDDCMSGRALVIAGFGLWCVGMFFLVRGFFWNRISTIGLTLLISGLVLQVAVWLEIAPPFSPPLRESSDRRAGP
jgi:hypothetical protein